MYLQKLTKLEKQVKANMEKIENQVKLSLVRPQIKSTCNTSIHE